MVYGPRGAPECSLLAREHSVVCQLSFTIIVMIAAALAPVGWPNIDDVTCLLTTPSIALRGSQYKEKDGPLQGGRRCWKIPHCHHHNEYTHYCLYYPPCRQRQKRKTLALYFPMAKILSRLHENLLRCIIYRAVLPFTQLQEISCRSWMQGGRRCWKIPHCHHHNQLQHHRLYCPPCQQHQKQKALAENIIHKCIMDHPKSCLHIFHPHNTWQWRSGELCQSNGRIHRATVDHGGVRIEGTGALWCLTTSTMNKAMQNHLTTLVQDLPAVCASVYHQISNQQGGGGATTAELTPSHRIRWMTEATFQPQGGLLSQQ